jgi:hypothetical protein
VAIQTEERAFVCFSQECGPRTIRAFSNIDLEQFVAGMIVVKAEGRLVPGIAAFFAAAAFQAY